MEINNSTGLIATNPTCVYIGMRKRTAPGCSAGGSLKSIADDEAPGACGINQKRIDSQWGPWGDVEHLLINATDEYKKVNKPRLTGSKLSIHASTLLDVVHPWTNSKFLKSYVKIGSNGSTREFTKTNSRQFFCVLTRFRIRNCACPDDCEPFRTILKWKSVLFD